MHNSFCFITILSRRTTNTMRHSTVINFISLTPYFLHYFSFTASTMISRCIFSSRFYLKLYQILLVLYIFTSIAQQTRERIDFIHPCIVIHGVPWRHAKRSITLRHYTNNVLSASKFVAQDIFQIRLLLVSTVLNRSLLFLKRKDIVYRVVCGIHHDFLRYVSD